MKKSILVGVVFLTLTACGKRQVPHNNIKIAPGGTNAAVDTTFEADNAPQVTAADSADTAKEKISEASLSCKDATQCSASVGAFFISRDNGIRECTVFLISDTEALASRRCLSFGSRSPNVKPQGQFNAAAAAQTNSRLGPTVNQSRILPGSVAAAKMDCNSPNSVMFPKAGVVEAFSTMCDSVEEIDQDTIKKFSGLVTNKVLLPGFVKLKLHGKATGRTPLKIETVAVSQDEVLSVYKTSFSETNWELAATQEKLNCAVTHKTLNLFQDSDNSPLIRLKNCDLSAGSVGSPLISSDQKVLGLVTAVGNKNQDGFKTISQKFKIINPNPFGIAVSGACLSGDSDLCKFDPAASQKNIEAQSEATKQMAIQAIQKAAQAPGGSNSKISAIEKVVPAPKTGFINGDTVYTLTLAPVCDQSQTAQSQSVKSWSLQRTINSDWELGYSDPKAQTATSSACAKATN